MERDMVPANIFIQKGRYLMASGKMTRRSRENLFYSMEISLKEFLEATNATLESILIKMVISMKAPGSISSKRE